MTKEELEEILSKHKLWVQSYGEEGQKADLSGADLKGADLSGADLTGTILEGITLFNTIEGE